MEDCIFDGAGCILIIGPKPFFYLESSRRFGTFEMTLYIHCFMSCSPTLFIYCSLRLYDCYILRILWPIGVTPTMDHIYYSLIRPKLFFSTAVGRSMDPKSRQVSSFLHLFLFFCTCSLCSSLTLRSLLVITVSTLCMYSYSVLFPIPSDIELFFPSPCFQMWRTYI